MVKCPDAITVFESFYFVELLLLTSAGDIKILDEFGADSENICANTFRKKDFLSKSVNEDTPTPMTNSITKQEIEYILLFKVEKGMRTSVCGGVTHKFISERVL